MNKNQSYRSYLQIAIEKTAFLLIRTLVFEIPKIYISWNNFKGVTINFYCSCVF